MRTTVLEQWIDPLACAHKLNQTTAAMVFLHSSRAYDYSGRYSYLAWDPAHTIQGSDLGPLHAALDQPHHPTSKHWFGYLGYGIKNQLEHLPHDTASFVNLPDYWFSQFHSTLLFDHEKQVVTLVGDKDASHDLFDMTSPTLTSLPSVVALHSNMTKSDYLNHVETLQKAIEAGDLYEANLTRKFGGHFVSTPDSFDCFLHLTKASPSPYSAFIRFDDKTVISSSPERFLSIDDNGLVNARPIKGSFPRHANPAEDNRLKQALFLSDKDRCENLMIVDLMRNDLSKSCVSGSVQVPALFEVSSFPHIHHMSSTITGQKREDITSLSLVLGCFPPGSMTGAPKIKAMEWCSNLEKMSRGIYSGCLGWFSNQDDSCDLSVVIRTIVMQGNRFEFQVGGAIIYDSVPESEWQETLIKAKGICNALGITSVEIAKL
ncbi:MAG: anthranilate synthase component I family protein [Alphaproteobacteria bacterium]|nr:anthranilate synthase component I family protein [Alphaproteobacteria bacterium]